MAEQDEHGDLGKSPWDKFIRLVYQETHFSYIEVEGERCYSGTTKWTSGTDSSCNCDGYSECTLERIYTSKPITYGLDFPLDSCKQVLSNLLEVNGSGEYFKAGVNNLIIRGRGSQNSDHRGSDHFKYDLDFHSSWTIPLPTTLDKIIDGLFRIKSNKTDSWYSLYCDVKTTESNGDLTLQLEFDYGS